MQQKQASKIHSFYLDTSHVMTDDQTFSVRSQIKSDPYISHLGHHYRRHCRPTNYSFSNNSTPNGSGLKDAQWEFFFSAKRKFYSKLKNNDTMYCRRRATTLQSSGGQCNIDNISSDCVNNLQSILVQEMIHVMCVTETLR